MFGQSLENMAIDAAKKADLNKDGIADMTQLAPAAKKLGEAVDTLEHAIDAVKFAAAYKKFSESVKVLKAEGLKQFADGVQASDVAIFAKPEVQVALLNVLVSISEVDDAIDQKVVGEAFADIKDAKVVLDAYMHPKKK